MKIIRLSDAANRFTSKFTVNRPGSIMMATDTALVEPASRPAKSGRRGGRDARRAIRTRPLEENARAIRPGLEGGCYKPLSQADIDAVHRAVLTVLEEVGLADAIPSCIEMTTANGAFLNDHGRLCFPKALVENVIRDAARDFYLHAQDPAHDLQPWGKKVHFGTAGAAVHMIDPRSREYRESNLNDLYDISRMVDALDNIHFLQRPLVARDMVDPRDLDINTLYATVTGTRKHIGTSFVLPEHVEEGLSMLHMIAGSEEAWRARPFVSMSNCFVVPPLKFAEDACRCLEVGVRGGMPVLLLAAGQAGATSPAALAGAVVQEVAEVLAALVYVNCIEPGAKAVFGTWPFVSDLRTGAMSGGSGEQALLMAACAQMGQFYNLPVGVASGMTDSKLPDAQSGYEKGYNHALVANSGANLIYEAAGMHASLLGFCLESLVIDNDIIGAALRTVRGIEINEDTLSVETMRDVCFNGPGHFLGSDQTLERMQKDYAYPEVGDRASPKEWREQGQTDILDRAEAKKEQILSSHFPAHIDAEMDQKIRASFDIKLPKSAMHAKG